jgi:hypothetical protein
VLTIGNYYDFTLYLNSVIGVDFTNAKVKSILDYSTAIKLGDVELTQRQIYPYLPPGTNSNYTNYTYYLIEYKNKDIIIADEWIIPTSIVQSQGTNYTIRLNSVTSSQYNMVRDQLRLLGISFDLL